MVFSGKQKRLGSSLAPLLVSVALLCAAPVYADEEVPQAAPKLTDQVLDKANGIVSNALGMVGIKYKWGGSSPATGFDCSGFVRYVYANALGVLLPRRSMDMVNIGQRVSLSDLMPGDLVFFKNKRGNYAHVGIYVGDNKFIHAPRAGRNIEVEEITARSFNFRLSGARRPYELSEEKP